MPGQHIRRTDLFLLRVWTRPGSDDSGESWSAYRGRVQRVVDGEVHEFESWSGLIEALVAMLAPKGEPTQRETGGEDNEQK